MAARNDDVDKAVAEKDRMVAEAVIGGLEKRNRIELPWLHALNRAGLMGLAKILGQLPKSATKNVDGKLTAGVRREISAALVALVGERAPDEDSEPILKDKEAAREEAGIIVDAMRRQYTEHEASLTQMEIDLRTGGRVDVTTRVAASPRHEPPPSAAAAVAAMPTYADLLASAQAQLGREPSEAWKPPERHASARNEHSRTQRHSDGTSGRAHCNT